MAGAATDNRASGDEDSNSSLISLFLSCFGKMICLSRLNTLSQGSDID